MNQNQSALYNFVSETRFFNKFTDEEKRKIFEKQMNFKRFEKKGTIICSEGQVGDSMYVILQGSLIVAKSYTEQKDSLSKKFSIVGKLKKGDVFGEISLIKNQKRTASVITESTPVICLEVTRDFISGFNIIIQKKFDEEIISLLVDRIIESNNKYAKLNNLYHALLKDQ